MSYLKTDEAYDYATLACWYQNSVDETQPPIWTDEHLDELLKDFYVIPKDTPTADVVPKSEVDSEIEAWQDLYADTVSKWEKAYEELEIKLETAKAEFARQIFEEIEKAQKEIVDRMQEFINEWKQYSESTVDYFGGKYEAMEVALRLVKSILTDKNAELKKKYTE